MNDGKPTESASDGAKRGAVALVAMTVLAVGLLAAGSVASSVRRRRNGRRRAR